MSARSQIALVCYLLVIFRLGAEGVLCLSASKFLPYHQEIAGVSWERMEAGVQTLLLSFCKMDGALMLTTAALMAALSFILFRRGEEWARWLTSSVGLLVLIPAALVSLSLAISTGAATPWPGHAIAILLLIVGFLLSRDLTRGTTIA